jgi:hypothetical protein
LENSRNKSDEQKGMDVIEMEPANKMVVNKR